MRRREFITLLGGAAASGALPFAASAQQAAMPVIGFLHAGAPEANANNVQAFRKGLGETGHFEGGNVSIDFQWAYGDLARYKELAAELVRRQVALIVTPLGTAAALAARRRLRPFRSSFPQAPIRCRSDWCRALNVRAATLPASTTCSRSWAQNDWACYTKWCRSPRASPCSPIRPTRWRPRPRSRYASLHQGSLPAPGR